MGGDTKRPRGYPTLFLCVEYVRTFCFVRGLQFFFSVGFSNGRTKQYFRLFRVDMFPSPQVTSIPVSNANANVAQPLVSLVLVQQLHSRYLRGRLIQTGNLIRRLRSPLFFYRRVPYGTIDTTRPITTLYRIGILVTLCFRRLLTQRRSSVSRTRRQVTTRVSVLRGIPMVGTLVIR